MDMSLSRFQEFMMDREAWCLVAEHGLQGEWASVAVARGLRSCVSGLQSSHSIVVVQELSYFVARGIFLDQGLNLRLLNWQLDFFSH